MAKKSLRYFVFLAARVVTVAMETGDINLSLNFSISVLLNLLVIAAIVVFDEQRGAKTPEVDVGDKNK